MRKKMAFWAEGRAGARAWKGTPRHAGRRSRGGVRARARPGSIDLKDHLARVPQTGQIAFSVYIFFVFYDK